MKFKEVIFFLLNKIKSIFVKDDNNYKRLYNQINVGDIIWGKRYNSNKEKKHIRKGHLEGPFIVLKKENNNLICSLGSGVIPPTIYKDKYFLLENDFYKLPKNTYFRIYKICTINNFSLIRIIDSLSENDKNELFKRIKYQRMEYKNELDKVVDLKLPLQPGDIINYNNLNFIIVDIKNNKFLLLPLFIEIDKTIRIRSEWLNNLDCSNLFAMDNNEGFKYLNTLSNDDYLRILKKYKLHIKQLEKAKEIQRGNIILKDDILYYVYGIDGKNLLVYEISKEYKSGADTFKVKKDIYYTKYKEFKILNSSDIKIICLIDNKLQDELKGKRKKYNDDINHISFVQKSCFKVGDVVRDKLNPKDKYIIIKVNHKSFECLSLNKLKEGIIDIKLIKKYDTSLISKKCLYEIEWFKENINFDLNEINNEVIKSIAKYQKEKTILEQNRVLINDNLGIDTGNIVRKKEFGNEEFIVKSVIGNIVSCASVFESASGRYKLQYFNKDELEIVSHKQKVKRR